MSTNFSTKGGIVTRGETYTKLLHHLREAQDQSAVMAHLEQTEDRTIKGKALAQGWLTISEQMKRFCDVVTQMAMGKMQ